MKKILSLMAGVLVSLTMLAGSNDLLWDYSEKAIPTTAPAEDAVSKCKLYFGAYVNDMGSGSNNKLNGVKMNSSGYAYFTKAGVAGKLKLTFGPRKATNEFELGVYTWSGAEAKAETLIKKTTYGGEYRTEVIELTAEQNNIYINRPSGSGEGVLQKIEFKENVARTFVDFEMVMCNMTAEYDGSTLPKDVNFSGTFNTDQHGYRAFTITVPVDGTVRFTIGDCSFGNQSFPVKNKKGETIATLKYPAAGCYKNDEKDQDKVFVYNYIGESDTLTFGPIQYCNYFKAEAAEITPCKITFKDYSDNVLGVVETIEGATFEGVPDTVKAKLPSLPEAMVFRGWFYLNDKKAAEGDPINGNTTIQAKATPIEYATVGSVQIYEFSNQTFYPEDHETVKAFNGHYHNEHGWVFDSNGAIKVKVAGKAVVIVTLCTYSNTGAVVLKDPTDKQLGRFDLEKEKTPDGSQFVCQYDGEAAELSIEWTSMQYIHKVVVYNVSDFMEKDASTGYYIIPKDDAASFLMAVAMAEKGDKIFLPNGIYDLGETVLTTIDKDSISIIGESMTGTIIKNAPDVKNEGISTTATLKINKEVKATYLQDLTLQNALDYYKNNDGRAVCLQDQGTQTVCKNVRMLSYQDTYYSNLQGAVKYFEDCEIHGTVDFICGDGSVYFKNNKLVAEQRQKGGGGSDALTASNAAESDKGYVFESCLVLYAEGIENALPVVSLGRSWNNAPKCVFLNTTLDDSNGKLVMTKDASNQKDKIARWTLGAMNALPELLGEYNSVDKDGKVVSPESNNVKFVLGSNEKTLETILSKAQADTYTMEYTLGAWAAKAAGDAKQAECEKEAKDFEADAIYMVEGDGEFKGLCKGSEFMSRFALYDGVNYIARKANARGGFGKTADESIATVESAVVSNEKVSKIIRDGQVYLMYNGKMYNVMGAEVK